MDGCPFFGYVQNVVGFPRFLAQSSVLSTTGQGWNLQFVLTGCYPAAGWTPPTTGPTNHGQAQTLLRYRPRMQVISAVNQLATFGSIVQISRANMQAVVYSPL